MKQVRVVLSPDAQAVYTYLNTEAPTSKTERMLLKAVNQKIELIKLNPQFGDPVAKHLIPPEYRRYEATNLFRVELPAFWRMLYTLTAGDTVVEIVAFVIDIIDHAAYDKKFGYRTI